MKPIWFVCAWLAFAIGIVGAFLPILPTTPFLILAAFLFSKSSPRFHAWILNLPLAGEGIKDWQQNRVIRTKAKIWCSIMILISVVVILTNGNIHLAVKIIVPIILVSVWAFVVSRKSE